MNKIFGTGTERTPLLDLSCESYGLVYRLAENGQEPVLRVDAQARFLGEVPVFNAFATIPGSAEPEEYVILGGHYDSWDGSTGALDNGTGAVAIMEAMRILKKAVPNPRRTIIGALWNGEEQGMNGSRAFVEDHPAILESTHTVFNVDHGAGPVTFIPMQGFSGAGGRFGEWLAKIPSELSDLVTLEIPGMPGSRRHGPRGLPVRGGAGIQLPRGSGAKRRHLRGRQPLGHERPYLAHHPGQLRQDHLRGPAGRRGDDRDARLSGVRGSGADAAGPAGDAEDEEWPECRPPERSSEEEGR